MVDEYFFKDAEQILYNEFQYVLQLESKEALMDYILPIWKNDPNNDKNTSANSLRSC